MVMEEWPTIRVLICSMNTGSFKRGNAGRIDCRCVYLVELPSPVIFGTEHEKFAASSVPPIPWYVATCG